MAASESLEAAEDLPPSFEDASKSKGFANYNYVLADDGTTIISGSELHYVRSHRYTNCFGIRQYRRQASHRLHHDGIIFVGTESACKKLVQIAKGASFNTKAQSMAIANDLVMALKLPLMRLEKCYYIGQASFEIGLQKYADWKLARAILAPFCATKQNPDDDETSSVRSEHPQENRHRFPRHPLIDSRDDSTDS